MATPPSAAQDTYIFKRDHRSMARLNYNHWLHVQLVGYLLHPSIPTQDPGLRIADIGTGTALVPIELSIRLHPSSRFDGFDVSAVQFPPKEWLPQNVHLYEHDVFKRFGKEFWGVYDIVHVRYLSTLVSNRSLGTLIANLSSLLKPGGYLQWSEPNMMSTSAIAISPSASKKAAEQLSQLMKKPSPGVEIDWVPILGDKISEGGLDIIADDHIPVPDHYRILFNLSHLVTLEDVVAARVPNTAEFSKGNEMLETLKSEFLDNGVSIDQTFVVVVARRRIKK